jgi:hypothetical protein
MGGWGRWWIAAILALAWIIPEPAGAQQPPIVIDPDAVIADSLRVAPPPPEVVARLIAVFNDTGTVQFIGGLTLPRGAALRGRVAVYRGVLLVHGRLTGPVFVINGDLHVGPEGAIDGDVVVTGGRIRIDPGGGITGTQSTWTEPAPVYRTPAGRLAPREERRLLGDLGQVSRSIYAGDASATLVLGTGSSYNRVEGMPITAGPSLGARILPGLDLRADARAIIRTTTDPTGIRARVGHDTRLELVFGVPARAVLGARLRSEVVPVERQPWSNAEAGWLTALWHEDSRDWYQARGTEIYGEAEPFRGVTLIAGVRREQEQSVLATDPLSLFRSNDPWRPNPLVDDGTYSAGRLRATLDTRNDREAPSSGWLVSGEYEVATSTDVAPVTLPRAVREPLPTEERYSYGRIWFDARRYARFGPDTRVNLRVQGGGWLHGDPLPVQRRVSVGGGDLLPGYRFRDRNCNPAGFADPARPALCDRALSLHAEVRRRVNLNLLYRLGRDELTHLDRFIGLDRADLVVFLNSGHAWLAGEGPGRVPNSRIPVIGEWATDLGAGLDTGGFAVYLARSLVDREPVRVTLRLQRRF